MFEMLTNWMHGQRISKDERYRWCWFRETGWFDELVSFRI